MPLSSATSRAASSLSRIPLLSNLSQLSPPITTTKTMSHSSVDKAPNSPTGGLWNTLGRVLSKDHSPDHARLDRSQSRGRDVASTGRGGAGNFVRSESASRAGVTRAEDGDERGRNVTRLPPAVTHAGRGGEGNVTSPSRDPKQIEADLAYEEDLLRKSQENRDAYGVSFGRGGSGNIDKSRSRSRDPKLATSNLPAQGHRELGSLSEEKVTS